MKNLITLFVCFTLFVMSGLSQEKYYKNWYKEYDEAEIKNSGVSNADTSVAGVVLFDRTCIDLMYEDLEGENQLVEYVTYYFKYNLNSEKAIEDFNKIYVNLNAAIDLERIQVRVITRDNEVIISDEKEILEAENFEEYGRQKYLAVKGMELGADLEYIYTVKKEPYFNGKRFLKQSSSPKSNIEFVFQCPTNLIYEFQSFNGFPEMVQDTIDTLVNRHSVFIEQMPGLNYDETYSAYTSSRQGVAYKLSENTATGKDFLVSYGELATTVYENLHSSIDKSDLKALKSISGKLKLTKLDEEQQLRKMEEYIKSNLNVVEKSSPELGKVSSVLKNKVVSNFGIIRLFVAWTEYLEIDYQLVFSIDRSEQYFDPKFESYHILDMYMLYYPSLNKYILPRIWNYRLGPSMPHWSAGYGIFLYPETLGDWKTYVYETRYIKAEDKEFTYTNHDIDVDLGTDFEKTEMKVKRATAGHEAVFFQPSFDELQGETKESIEQFLTEYIGDGEEKIEAEFVNGTSEDLFVNPFIVKSTINYPNLVSQAGNKYLVNIGKVIGPQSELYNKKDRTMDIALDYNHKYERAITIKIPDGYSIKNAQDLVFHKELKEGDKITMLFDSDFELTKSELKITVYEYYDQIHTSKDYYDDFKAVINAAANFNKVVLIFEK